MDQNDLSVVIVGDNHRSYLGPCFEALAEAIKEIKAEVWFVDNASSDGSREFVAAHYPWIRLIASQQKQGFAANNNLGMRQARGRYILLLNPDTEVQPAALTTLVLFMDARPAVGACGAQLLFPDGTIQPSCRRFPGLASFLVRRTPLRRFLWGSSVNARHLMADLDHNVAQRVDWLLGACLMVRREVIDTVGLMDEWYFLYVEDIDWCYRMWQRGWQVWYVPSAKIIHHHLAVSDKALLSQRSWIHFQSMVRFYRKFWAPDVPFLRIRLSG